MVSCNAGRFFNIEPPGEALDIEALTPIVTVFGDEVFKEVIRLIEVLCRALIDTEDGHVRIQ